MCPVYKKGEKQSVSNYRPISLTCIVSKLLEKIVYKYLYAMLEFHDLLHDHQFGFRRKRSTTSLLMSAVHDYAAGLNLGQTTYCLFLDMSKAFDSVLHERLLKLQSYGVGGALLVWFNCFLTTRRQRCLQGCPRALFWALYFSSCMLMTSQNLLIVNLKFMIIYHQVSSIQDCHFLQQNLNSCLQWCSRWQINLNPAKCEACVFLTNNLHLLLYTTVKINPFSGNKE